MKAAVLDIGGSSIKYGQMDESLEVQNRGKVKTPLEGMEELFAALDEVWENVGSGMDGLTISMPGVIDSVRGYALSGGALTYLNEREFAKELKDRYQVPVWIGNDAKCAGVAEVGYGALKGVDTGIAIILGTGIGGCLILNGEVYFGKHFSAGEVSFLHTDYHRPYGGEEWWAAINGSKGLLAFVQRCRGSSESFSGEEIFAMAKDGNEAVLEAISQFSEAVAVQLFNMQCICDAEKVAIGGGISAQPLLLEKINQKFDELYDEFPYPIYRPEIVPCRFRNDANLIGAYYQFCQMMKK